jgi:hypothetical protein
LSEPLRFLADEDFRGEIVRRVRSRLPDLDMVRVQDVGLSGKLDPVVLEWAAQHGRIVLTHDRKTMTACAADRLRVGLSFPGVCVVRQSTPIGRAIEDLLVVLGCSFPEDWENQIRYVPL